MVGKARRILGFGGAFPPYKTLVDQCRQASGFEEAFKLGPLRGDRTMPEPIVEMAYEHQLQSTTRKDCFPGWRREEDWWRAR